MTTKEGALRGSIRNVGVGVNSIPDSAVHLYRFDEGSGTTVADSVGDADGTVNGATWVSGTWVGDNTLEGDGVDDYVDLPVESYGGTHLNGSCAIAFTIQTTNKDFDDYFSVSNSNDDTSFRVFSRDGGELDWRLNDESGSGVAIETNDGVDYSDGNKHRIVLQKSSDSGADFDIAADGSIVSTTDDTSTLGTITDFEYPWAVFARRSGSSSLSSHVDAAIDNIILHDSDLTTEQITYDYDKQPWS